MVKKIVCFFGRIPAKLLQRMMNVWHKAAFRYSYTGIHGKLVLGKGNSFIMPVSRRYALGTIEIGDDNWFGYLPAGFHGEILLQPREQTASIKIGSHCRFSNSVSIISCCSIEIGDSFLCGDRVTIVDSDFHGIRPTRQLTEENFAPVRIGNNVWLGSEVTVLKGVSIGENAVIGAKSLVCSDIPENCVAAGNPAVVIKKIQ